MPRAFFLKQSDGAFRLAHQIAERSPQSTRRVQMDTGINRAPKTQTQNLFAFVTGQKSWPGIPGTYHRTRRERVEGGDAAFREDVAEPPKKKTEDQSPPVSGAIPGQRPPQR